MAGILLCGALGKMCKAVTAKVAETEDLEIVAGVDLGTAPADYPIYKSFADVPAEVTEQVDAVIDFSHPSVFEGMLTYLLANKMPAVVCTTGLSAEQVNKLKSAAYETPIFYSANMSLGVNLLIELARKAAKALGEDFDIEVVEMHHNQKVDAPSGTALMLANAISEELATDPAYEYDRHAKREKRPKNEIGIHSLRGGNVVGEHQVVFAGKDELITLSHSARSKTLFAGGAVNAARFLIGKENGLFSMKDLIG